MSTREGKKHRLIQFIKIDIPEKTAFQGAFLGEKTQKVYVMDLHQEINHLQVKLAQKDGLLPPNLSGRVNRIFYYRLEGECVKAQIQVALG